MGLWSSVKKKVKQTYAKADSAVGGYLPGGVTPSEHKATQYQGPVQPTTNKKTFRKTGETKNKTEGRAIKDIKKIYNYATAGSMYKTVKKAYPYVKKGLEKVHDFVDQPGAREAREKAKEHGFSSLTREEQMAATDYTRRLFVSPGKLGKTLMTHASKKGIKEAGMKTMEKIIKSPFAEKTPLHKSIDLINKLGETRAAGKLSRITGVPTDKILSTIKQTKLQEGIKHIGSPSWFAKLTPKTLAGKLVAGTTVVVGGLIGSDTLMVWYALDNVLGGAKFYTRDLADGAEDGTLNPLDAQESLKNTLKSRDIAKGIVKYSTYLNPLLWPFKNLMLTGSDVDDEAIQLQVDRINATAAKYEAAGGVMETPETFDEGVDRRAKEKRDRELQFREEDQTYYDGMAANRRNQEIKEQEQDQEYYNQISEDRRKLDIQASEEERERTALFWEKIALEKRAMEMEWRRQDQLYYEQLAEQREIDYEKYKKSQLKFGLLG